MKVYKDGQEYHCTKPYEKPNRRAINKAAKANSFKTDISSVMDEADQYVNMTFKEKKVISNSLAKNSKLKKTHTNDSKINESKYEYNIQIKNVKKSDWITIKFLMPQRENIAADNEYERPGRIAAYATLSLQQIISSV